MTTTEQDADAATARAQAQAHRAALAAMDMKKDQIHYACEQLPSPTGGSVRKWLQHYGVDVGRSSAATIVGEWRREHGMVSTGDLKALTTEMIAELDAARGTADSRPNTRTEHLDGQASKPPDTPNEYAVFDAPEAPEVPMTPDSRTNTEHQDAAVAGANTGDRRPTEHPEPTTEHPDGVAVPATDTRTEHPGSTEHPEVFAPVTEQPAEVFAAAADTRSTKHLEQTPNTGTDRTADGHTEQTSVVEPAAEAEVAGGAEPAGKDQQLVVWPVLLMALSAFVSIWSGWVGLGEMTGFGVVRPLPGISEFELNTAITLPIGVEAYASYALYVWLSGRTRTDATREFAKWSAIGSLALGAAGQVAYHLLMQSQDEELGNLQAAANAAAAAVGQKAPIIHPSAPWWITTFVACLPVIVVGMGAALAHMVRGERETEHPRRKRTR
ncbi:hypothetical protein [Nocardia gipuzkoensis]